MPEIRCFAVAGIELWFNSNDHLPPHFHAEKARDWAVRVFFMRDAKEMVEIEYSFRKNKPSNGDLKELREQAALHRLELLEQWELAVDVKAPGPQR